jgi:hypothetical protein
VTVTLIATGTEFVPEAVQMGVPPEESEYRENLMAYVPSVDVLAGGGEEAGLVVQGAVQAWRGKRRRDNPQNCDQRNANQPETDSDAEEKRTKTRAKHLLA